MRAFDMSDSSSPPRNATLIWMKLIALCPWLLALLTFSGCEPGQAEPAASSVPDAQEKSQAPSDPEPKADKKPYFRIVKHKASGPGCRIGGDQPNATALITKTLPDGPDDYAQWIFDDLEAPGDNEEFSQYCVVTLSLEWSPGYRVKSKALIVDLWANGPMETRFELNMGYTNRTAHRVESVFDDLESSTSMTFKHGKDMSSDCSGQGEWHAVFDLKVPHHDHEASAIQVTRASIQFELAGRGELGSCTPKPTVPPTPTAE